MSCIATSCEMVGEGFNPGGLSLALLWNGALGAPRTLGEFSPGLASWRLETTPDLSATFNTLHGGSCASATNCQAVGQWQDFRGLCLTLAIEWGGFAWSYESTPNPAAPTVTFELSRGGLAGSVSWSCSIAAAARSRC